MASLTPMSGLLLSCDVQDNATIQGSDITTKIPLRLPQDRGLFGYLRPQGRILMEASPDTLEILPGRITRNMLTYKVGDYVNPIIVLNIVLIFTIEPEKKV